MDSNKTYVDFGKFEQLILDSGLQWEEKAGWVKVTGQRGRKVYVARTKRVGRVDVAGLGYDGPGVRDLDEDEAHGSVDQGLEFRGRTEDEILATFQDLLAHMAKLPAVEGPARRPRETRGNEAGGQEARPAGRPSMGQGAQAQGPAQGQQGGQGRRKQTGPQRGQQPAAGR